MFDRLRVRLLLSGLVVSASCTVADTVVDRSTEIHGAPAPLQWTPHAITVVDAAETESTYRRDLEDLQGNAPGLIVDALGGTPQGAAIALRGIGSANVSNGFEPAVAVSIDGVYVGTHASRMQVLFDFETVEVRRGPQATFTAAPNLSGSVQLTRTKPKGEYDVDMRAREPLN